MLDAALGAAPRHHGALHLKVRCNATPPYTARLRLPPHLPPAPTSTPTCCQVHQEALSPAHTPYPPYP